MDPVADAETFGASWLDAWNDRDLDAVMGHYAPDVDFVSPLVARLGGGADGRVRGTPALRSYFSKALSVAPELRFAPVGYLAGVDSVAIVYRNHRRQLVAEVCVIDAGHVVGSRVHYGTPLS